ncbi:hypothetical protein SLEP1_g50705 [Rubroshorea leprosula]|uniref:Uncharacterized protein n=1 Tax=Rubroshorea leprosula TaxID=152421 RepID=A0AAV5M0W2_9ROSI|nr:hypothetical protein SLEP1_g50705 [Rubroshorea leprosula]
MEKGNGLRGFLAVLILLALQVVLPVAQEEDITVLPAVTAPSPETEPVPEVPPPVPGTPLLPAQSPFIPPEISQAPRTHSLPSILFHHQPPLLSQSLPLHQPLQLPKILLSRRPVRFQKGLHTL